MRWNEVLHSQAYLEKYGGFVQLAYTTTWANAVPLSSGCVTKVLGAPPANKQLPQRGIPNSNDFLFLPILVAGRKRQVDRLTIPHES